MQDDTVLGGTAAKSCDEKKFLATSNLILAGGGGMRYDVVLKGKFHICSTFQVWTRI